MKSLVLIPFLVCSLIARSQTYPTYGPEIDVSLNGFTSHAMEPFISPEGNYMFFNNLNDGETTRLYYAIKTNDSTFIYVGELDGTNQLTIPYLDAVADMDASNNFYWTSTRDYPAELDNLFHGTFNAGSVSSIGRVHGDFNKGIPGWLVMDHGISYDGELLYYNNARLDNLNCQGPCETEMGIAQKVNDSTFNQIPNSDLILQNITDPDYIYYAPCISSDNLELYYTRYPRDTITPSTLFEICVAVRNSPTDNFSVPAVLFSEFIADLIEAATLTTDKQVIYYHRKIPGSHKIVMRYRTSPLSVPLSAKRSKINIYPNPAKGQLTLETEVPFRDLKLSVITANGESLITLVNQTEIDIKSLVPGTYFLRYEMDGESGLEKFIVIE